MTLNISDIKYKQQYEIISDPVQIKIFLKRILDSRTLLSATIPGDNEIFNSVTISIDNDNHQFMIDQLHPEHGHARFLQKNKLTIFAIIDDIDLSFTCVLVDVNEESGIPFYTLSFPQSIKYYQKRSSYRVQIIRSLSIPVILTCDSDEKFEGELDNISSGGMRIRFADNLPQTMKNGLSIKKCAFELPDEGYMLCSAELRHIAHGERGNLSYMGIHFEGLNPLDQRSINRFVTSIERELRRRTPT